MAKYAFSKAETTHEVGLGTESEVFTNCSQITVVRIVCGERFESYKTLYKGTSQVLPAGDYEFICMDGCPDCWACTESLVDAPQQAQVVCIQKKGVDEPSKFAWISGCTQCESDFVGVSLFSINGQEKLNPDHYLITKCC